MAADEGAAAEAKVRAEFENIADLLEGAAEKMREELAKEDVSHLVCLSAGLILLSKRLEGQLQSFADRMPFMIALGLQEAIIAERVADETIRRMN